MNKYFSMTDKVYDVTEKYPELIELFANRGFENLRNKMMRKLLGSTITIEAALKMKKLDRDAFEAEMIQTIENASPDILNGLSKAKIVRDVSDVKMTGILPCPIRIQMVEKLDHWIGTQDQKIDYDLQAASMGVDWLEEKVLAAKDASELEDVYLSAGYGFFFDKEGIGKYQEEGIFTDLTGIEKFNSDFDNDYIDLKDPKKRYNIVGVVPAIFMVNTELLGDLPMPTSWKDLLKPEYEGTMAIPMGDLDLFNAILLGIYKEYGAQGVAALGRGAMRSMHPAQMVKTGNRKSADTPIITIMPYFFSFMNKENGPMKAVWPTDGAIISPIFFLSKKEKEEKVKPLVDFLFSKEMGSVLSADGKFPSTHPDCDNALSGEKKFLWPGWDFIYSHDIKQVLKDTEDIFYNGLPE